mgnify:CR=1 FL=1
MLPFRLVESPSSRGGRLPLFAYSVGRHRQLAHHRSEGFPAHQIFLVKEGRGLFRDLESGKEHALTAGHAFAYPADRPHEYYPLTHEPWIVGFVGFLGALAEPLLQEAGLLPSEPLAVAAFDRCWDDVGSIWFGADAPDSQSPSDLSAGLYRLILRLADERTASIDEPAALSPEEVRNQALRQALLLMNQHYDEPLLVSHLARAVGYSPQHFQRLFLQVFSVTPNRYLQNLRMERAKQLLSENGGMRIQEIARKVGMETNYFVRLFRRTYGATPGAMQSKNRP